LAWLMPKSNGMQGMDTWIHYIIHSSSLWLIKPALCTDLTSNFWPSLALKWRTHLKEKQIVEVNFLYLLYLEVSLLQMSMNISTTDVHSFHSILNWKLLKIFKAVEMSALWSHVPNCC
jgi:hypothetical protein